MTSGTRAGARTKQLVVVIGAGGQLGTAMAPGLARHHEVVSFERSTLDVTDAEAAEAALRDICPDVIVNCSAYTDVEGAERQPTTALEVNALAVRTLSRIATEIDAALVHFSTDFVFDGRTDRPYTEEDAPNPLSAYAASKLLGEWFAENAPQHYVLRVASLFGGPRSKSTIDGFLDKILSGTLVRAFTDRTLTPSFVDDVVSVTAALIEHRIPSGVYHCVSSEVATWYEVARELAVAVSRPEAPIEGISVKDLQLKASRPQFAALSNAKLAAAGYAMPSWQDAIGRYISQRL